MPSIHIALGPLAILGIILVLAKVFGLITLGWIWVTFPFWFPMALLVLLICICLMIFIIGCIVAVVLGIMTS